LVLFDWWEEFCLELGEGPKGLFYMIRNYMHSPKNESNPIWHVEMAFIKLTHAGLKIQPSKQKEGHKSKRDCFLYALTRH